MDVVVADVVVVVNVVVVENVVVDGTKERVFQLSARRDQLQKSFFSLVQVSRVHKNVTRDLPDSGSRASKTVLY